jgi:hypothetical protein
VVQELLDGANVVAVLEEVRNEAVAQRVARGALGDARGAAGVPEGALEDRLVEVVTAPVAGRCGDVAPGKRGRRLADEAAGRGQVQKRDRHGGNHGNG